MSTDSADANSSFFDEFLDDFFIECDEHLTLIRHGLLALERFVNAPPSDRALLDDLFRAFHSLKGLAGMVGVTAMEQLAHQMESYLRALQQQHARLSAEAIDALNIGTRLLEQSVAARRNGSSEPEIAATLARLEALMSAPEPTPASAPEPTLAGAPTPAGPSALSPDESARLAQAQQQGQHAWRVLFTPTPQLAAQGINVNSLRGQLQARAELIRATPQVLASGGVAFEFLVVSSVDIAEILDGQDDGLTFVPYDLPTSIAPNVPTPAQPLVDAGSTTTPSNVVRVDLARLDELMRMVGDLVITRARLEDYMTRVEHLLPVNEERALREIHLAFERQLRELRTGVMRTRMLPIGTVFARMQFVIRDLARDLHKQVALELSGQDTEIDKFVVERIMDPLLHLVRNAISHGMELPSERVARGKPPVGIVALRAATVGDMVMISIEDDGRGIDVEQVAARARALGVIAADASLDADRLLDVLCAPGFSTREQVDRVSGRGVGMDVVATTVRELGGVLALSTTPGHGTTFTLHLPLTLSIMDALIVAVADQRFAVPLQAVREVIAVQPELVSTLERNELLPYRDGALPLVRLARRFQLEHARPIGGYACVIGSGHAAAGMVVDRIVGKREIVVRPLSDPLTHTVGIAGATELGDGRVVLILDPTALVRAT